MEAAYLSGFFTGGGLIVAVGAQNAFLLEQALKKHYALWLALLFILCDMISISVGALGIGALIVKLPWIMWVAKFGGAAFLIWFAVGRIKMFFMDQSLVIQKISKKQTGSTLLLTALAVTWLNPHFYLETLVLMGSVANQWSDFVWHFVLGGISASTCWFLSLVLLGRGLARYLTSALFWKWFNLSNGLIVLYIGIQIGLQ